MNYCDHCGAKLEAQLGFRDIALVKKVQTLMAKTDPVHVFVAAEIAMLREAKDKGKESWQQWMQISRKLNEAFTLAQHLGLWNGE